MAGDLMRTPVLQNIVKKITNLDVSKGIIIDECPSLGVSLYGAYINDKFPLPKFEGIASFLCIQCYIQLIKNILHLNPQSPNSQLN